MASKNVCDKFKRNRLKVQPIQINLWEKIMCFLRGVK